MNRRLLTVMAVMGVHLLSLWALLDSLSQRQVDPLEPVPVVAELLQRTEARMPSTPPPRPATPLPAQERPGPSAVRPPPAPVRPMAQTPGEPTPAALPPQLAPASPSDNPANAPSPRAAPANEAVASPPAAQPSTNTATPARIELPSSSAQYLNNPRPPYPIQSKRLGEQGKVVVRVLIDANGMATQAEIRSSSGYERLDQTALQTVLRWRYVPGKRNGVAEAMWFNVPIQFVLE